MAPTGQEKGHGGRNQGLVLAAASRIAGSRNVVIASVDSDGPTGVAGPIIDGQTMQRMDDLGFNLVDELKSHNSEPVLEALGDTFVIGNTGTNVRDLRVVYVGKPAS